MRIADEVQDRAALLVPSQPQPAAQLLQEDGRALRRSQEEDRVDRRNIDALVEQVDREQDLHLTRRQGTKRIIAFSRPRLSGDHPRLHAALVEPVGHEARMLEIHAEPERAHPRDVGDLGTIPKYWNRGLVERRLESLVVVVFDRRAVVWMVALAMGCGPKSDPWTGDVAIMTVEDNRERLRIVDSASGDGATIEPATRIGSSVVAWTPDGSSITYVGSSDKDNPSSYDDTLRLVDPDGDHPIGELDLSYGAPQNTHGMWWSPRGDVLVLRLDVYYPVGTIAGETLSVLFFLDASIEPRVRRVFHTEPSWAPDGTRVVAVHRDDLGVDENYNPVFGDGDLVIVDNDGDVEALAVNTSADEIRPAWSPDGEWIAFVRQGGPAEGTYVVAVGGGAEQRVASAECDGDVPQWFPDSRRLLVNCGEILLEVDARSGTLLAQHPGPPGTLSPEGDRVLGISADEARHVEARDLDGSNRVNWGLAADRSGGRTWKSERRRRTVAPAEHPSVVVGSFGGSRLDPSMVLQAAKQRIGPLDLGRGLVVPSGALHVTAVARGLVAQLPVDVTVERRAEQVDLIDRELDREPAACRWWFQLACHDPV